VKFAPDADLHAVCAAPAGFGVGPPTAPAPRLWRSHTQRVIGDGTW